MYTRRSKSRRYIILLVFRSDYVLYTHCFQKTNRCRSRTLAIIIYIMYYIESMIKCPRRRPARVYYYFILIWTTHGKISTSTKRRYRRNERLRHKTLFNSSVCIYYALMYVCYTHARVCARAECEQ